MSISSSIETQSSLPSITEERQKHETIAVEISPQIRNVVQECRSPSEKEICLNSSTESHVALVSNMQQGMEHKNSTHEISSQVKHTVQDSRQVPSKSEQEQKMHLNKSTEPLPSLQILKETPKQENIALDISPPVKNVVQANRPLLENEMCLNTSTKAEAIIDRISTAGFQYKNDAPDILPEINDVIEANRIRYARKIWPNRSFELKRDLLKLIPSELKYKGDTHEISSEIKNTVQVTRTQPEKDKCINISVEPPPSLKNFIQKQVNEELLDLQKFFEEWTKFHEWVKLSMDKQPPTESKVERFSFWSRERKSFMRAVQCLDDLLEQNPRLREYKLRMSQPKYQHVDAIKLLKTERPCVSGAEWLQNFESYQPAPPSKAALLLDHIERVKPQEKARELNIRKLLAPSQIDRQNKVQLYEGKAKNNRRKDLWRCHSGVNNNRKCC